MAADKTGLANLFKGKLFEMSGPIRFRSPPKQDVLAWRASITAKYQGQLGEKLIWNEDSVFNLSEDATLRGDMLLRYVAGRLDQLGPDAARAFVRAQMPARSELAQVFAEGERRGFAGQFPQLLLGASYWLPFKRNLIIEEPDWSGNVARYGSLPALAEELSVIRAFISDADPTVTAWSAQRTEVPDDTLAAAWQASDTISRLCGVATDQRLPLWITG